MHQKIISLVVALAMVLAMAAGASALTGDLYEPAPTAGGVMPYTNIRLRLVESASEEIGFGLFNLAQAAEGSAYFPGQRICFALEFTTPDEEDITIHALDYVNPAVVLSSAVVDFCPGTFTMCQLEGATVSETAVTVEHDPDNPKKVTVSLPFPVDSGAVRYVLTGCGLVRGTSSGALQAEFQGDYTSTKFFGPVHGGNITELMELAKGLWGGFVLEGMEFLYHVMYFPIEEEMQYIVFNLGDDMDDISALLFYTDLAATVAGSTKNVTKIEILIVENGDATAWLVNDTGVDISGGGTSSLQFYRADGADGLVVLSPACAGEDLTTYNRLKSWYQEVMGYFGLQYSREGILLPIHFSQKFSIFYAKSEVRVALSHAAAADPDLALPATGGGGRHAGLGMAALAVALACGLAWRRLKRT